MKAPSARAASARPAKMSPDTVFRIASMVKLLTSVAAMQLVERGKLKLDEPAEQIDPELASPPVSTGFDDKGAPQLRTARKPLTLRNLLTHTSGYTYPLWDADVVRYLKCCKTDKKLPRKPLTFDPDAKWAYGGSIDKVGRLVEIASGMPLDRYFQDYITGPLGMHNTGFNLTASQRAREASVHRRNADGSFRPEPPEKPVVTKVFLGGGGIYSTAPDYLTLLQALLNGGSLRGVTILKPETVALMSAEPDRRSRSRHHEDDQSGAVERRRFLSRRPQALGFWAHDHPRSRKDGRKAGSLTWAGLLNTYYWIDPASGIAGVIMTQMLPFADARALKLYRAFEPASIVRFKSA